VKVAARLVGLAGAALVGWLLFRAAPRDVTLVYDVGQVEGAGSLEVRIRRGAEILRAAEFRLPDGGGQVRHTVQLPDGHYRIAYRLVPERARPGDGQRPVEGERALDVTESGTVVLPLGR
jgi:hypothetical protein